MGSGCTGDAGQHFRSEAWKSEWGKVGFWGWVESCDAAAGAKAAANAAGS